MIESKILGKLNEIKHGFFNRNGGKSKGIYRSLNCGIGSSDKKHVVKKNLRIVKNKIDKNSKNHLVLDKAIASRIDEESLKLGLIIRPIYHICVLSPALIITKEQIDVLIDKLYTAIINAKNNLKNEGLWTE